VITLGIHDGHTATAAIARDGQIIAAISEERMVRRKEFGGFPAEAIQRCLEICRIDPRDIEGVGFVGLGEPTLHEYYDQPTAYKKLFALGTHVLPGGYLRSHRWVPLAQRLSHRSRKKAAHCEQLQALGIGTAPRYFEHHTLHAATVHFQSPWGTEENLIITNDGSGDAVAATVSVGRGKTIERLATISNYNSMGEFYTRITQYLGMKPMSHEYKVMGLAPYAKAAYGLKTFELMKDWFQLPEGDPLVFENHSGHWRWQYLRAFRELFNTTHRFDNIAWAAQHLVEQVQTEWVRRVVEKTGIRRVLCSGGVFLNVKANHCLLELDEIERLFIFPSGGDESLAMGAALQLQVDAGVGATVPLGPLYLGDSFDDEAIERELAGWPGEIVVERREDIHRHVGRMLSQGLIVARFFGRMEWGARALGNRTIMADGRRPDVVMRINEAIKNRDFWMPFAPSVLHERADDYFVNPKKFYGPYMVMAFPSTELAREHIRGGLHPYDFTGRPQMVQREWNPEYYEVLKSFEEASGGVGGTINTSFNLHGEAIVRTPKDAVETFLNSGLDALAIGHYFVTKKNAVPA